MYVAFPVHIFKVRTTHTQNEIRNWIFRCSEARYLKEMSRKIFRPKLRHFLTWRFRATWSRPGQDILTMSSIHSPISNVLRLPRWSEMTRNHRSMRGDSRSATGLVSTTPTPKRWYLQICLCVGVGGVVMSCFVDADHTGRRVTRRSHTGVIIFVNRAPILWFSKRQNTTVHFVHSVPWSTYLYIVMGIPL